MLFLLPQFHGQLKRRQKRLTKKFRVGFIGLGLMGGPMALNIYKAHFPLAIYNRSSKRLIPFKKLKEVIIVRSPKEVAENSDVVITMVTAPQDVKDVILGKDGVVSGAHSDLVIVDMSTIGPTAAKDIARALKKKNIPFLDAPVTGSTDRAKSGELTILVGGEKAIFEKVRPVLQAMGNNIYYIGDSGKGQAIKLVNNMIGAISIEALAEGMLLADALGIKRKQVLEALGSAPLISTNMRMKMPNMIKNKFPTAFSLANMRKDLKLALDEHAKKHPKKFPTLTKTENLLKQGMDKGLAEKDYSAVIEVLSHLKN